MHLLLKMAYCRFVPQTCAQAMADDETQPVDQTPSTADIFKQLRSMERDFDYVERPSEDFFCPVSLELLLEPQLTSCCGHHLSLEAATRLQREGKACPLCNGKQWSIMLDKYHRRKVHEVRVRCWHTDNGCAWVGEVNDLKRHADACEKRPWECQYCALKCLYGEGEEKHWSTCLKFPEPCPNRCEVGSVERCNMEQHHSVCSLEPVTCEMKEFGCSVVVPRKELATHMRESELQHLTAMTVLNLRLSRQLQQDSTERDRKIAQLQQEISVMQKEMKTLQTKMKTKLDEMTNLQSEILNEQKGMQTGTKTTAVEQKQSQTEMNCKISQLQSEMRTKIEEVKLLFPSLSRQLQQEATERDKKTALLQQQEMTGLKQVQGEMKQVQVEMNHKISQLQTEMSRKMTFVQSEVETSIAGLKQVLEEVNKSGKEPRRQSSGHVQEAQSPVEQQQAASNYGCEVFTYTQYGDRKECEEVVDSAPFYTHYHGYKFKLQIMYYTSPHNDIGAYLYLMKGEYDSQLPWPLKVKVRLDLLNQAGDHRHVVRTADLQWDKCEKKQFKTIDDYIIKYATVERCSGSVHYLKNDCLKFKISVTVL